MYKLLLIFKYLRKRRIAWVSLAAVTLSTALVLVVISVMGGWLRTFRASFHGLNGDVIAEAQSMSGFAYYDEMIPQIEAIPEVGKGHAVPVIQSFGLINIAGQKTSGVQVLGYQIGKIGAVNDFAKSLHWEYQKPMEEEARKRGEKELTESEKEQFLRALPPPSFKLRDRDDYLRAGYVRPDFNIDHYAGMIAGIGVVQIHKNEMGKFVGRFDNLYRLPVVLTVLNVDPNDPGLLNANRQVHSYFIVDDSCTGVYPIDSKTVYVPFEQLQSDLGMGEIKATNNVTKQEEILPARTSQIDIKVQPGADLVAVKNKVQDICDRVIASHLMGDDSLRNRGVFGSPVTVETWEDSQATYLQAIEHEKLLMIFLFGLMSIVSILLIFCIFYMIVMEKTRDIGIIKSIGATRNGVAEIFLGYGLAIGLVGGFAGLDIAWLIVHNINYLHAKLGQLFHIQIWNPEVYAFDTIPNTMDAREVSVIVCIAILSSVLGALIPAVVAGRKHPVEALRSE